MYPKKKGIFHIDFSKRAGPPQIDIQIMFFFMPIFNNNALV